MNPKTKSRRCRGHGLDSGLDLAISRFIYSFGLNDKPSRRKGEQIRYELSLSCCLLPADAHKLATVLSLCCDTTIRPIGKMEVFFTGIHKMHIS